MTVLRETCFHDGLEMPLEPSTTQNKTNMRPKQENLRGLHLDTVID